MRGINLPEPYRGIEDIELRVELDKKALFALASDTRMDILKTLQPNRRTVSQLAEIVGVDKAAVHRHLKKLEEGGFVKREEDHGFVYYGLSWKARDILSPNENTKIVCCAHYRLDRNDRRGHPDDVYGGSWDQWRVSGDSGRPTGRPTGCEPRCIQINTSPRHRPSRLFGPPLHRRTHFNDPDLVSVSQERQAQARGPAARARIVWGTIAERGRLRFVSRFSMFFVL